MRPEPSYHVIAMTHRQQRPDDCWTGEDETMNAHTDRRGKLLSVLTCAAACCLSGMVFASSISPGFDLFSTTSAEVDLTGIGLGVVPLDGKPFGPGDTDTIVERLDGIDPLEPPAGNGIINIELVALQLKSVDPVDLTPLGGPFVGVFSDLFVTVNKDGAVPGVPQPDPLAPSLGRMEVIHTQEPPPDPAGPFDSCFGDVGDGGACASLGSPGSGIYADMIFAIVGGDPSDPGDVLISTPAQRVALIGEGLWVHIRPPGVPDDPFYPAGDFFVTEIEHTGPHGVIPTVVELASFTAKASFKQVLLEWETLSEIDNAGFEIWRFTSEGAGFERITAAMIPAEGNPLSGAVYEFADGDVESGRTYWYTLEDMDIYGISTFHGPVSATVFRLPSLPTWARQRTAR